MNDIEKAIDGFKRMKIGLFNAKIDGEPIRPYLDTAISALEKQILKPCAHCQETDIAIFYNDLLVVRIDYDNELEIEFQDGRETKREWIKIEYCPKCGRELDWSVEE